MTTIFVVNPLVDAWLVDLAQLLAGEPFNDVKMTQWKQKQEVPEAAERIPIVTILVTVDVVGLRCYVLAMPAAVSIYVLGGNLGWQPNTMGVVGLGKLEHTNQSKGKQQWVCL